LKITIGIPTYNQAAFIEKAVESALAQDYPELEVIVADDDPAGNIASLLKKYGNDPRFHYYQNEQRLGRTGNYRNLLYKLATGEWYINLDGDDYFTDPGFISRAATFIQQNKSLVAVIADCTLLDETNNSRFLYSSAYADGQLVSGLQFLKDVAAQQAQTTHAGTLYKRKKAMDLDFYRNDILGSDFESIYRLALTGDMLYLHKAVVTWRKHGANTVTTKPLKEVVRNLVLPAAVSDYARSININLGYWKKTMLKNMIRAALVEAKKEGRLLQTFLYLFSRYPAASLGAVMNIKKVFKHFSST
jgi:glycosyltransferase involved in cell wall biosynthesis